MGNACLSKHQSFAGTASGGRHVATIAPELVTGAKMRAPHVKNFVRINRKAAVLHLNAALPDESPPPPPTDAKIEEAAVSKREEKRKQEELKKQKQEELKKQKQEELNKKKQEEQEAARKQQEEEEAKKAEEAAKRKERRQEEKRKQEEEKRRQEEEARRRHEEEEQRKQAEAVKKKEDAKMKLERQKRQEAEAKEEERKRLEAEERKRKRDAARVNTYSLRQLRSSYTSDFPTFLLNNTLMAVQFGKERELFEKVRTASNTDIRETEMSTRMYATGHFKRALCPDALHEHLAQAVRFIPEDDPYVATGVPLRPLRVMVNHDDIQVKHQAEPDVVPSRILKLCVEQGTSATGYARLLNMDPRLPKLGTLDPGTIDPEEGYPSFSDLEDQQSTIPAAVRVPEALSSSESEPDERRPSISWNLGGIIPHSERKSSYSTVATQGGSSSSKGSSGYKSGGSRLSVPKSVNSNSDSEHSYSTIASLRRQQLLAERRLQLTGAPASKVGLPSTCFIRKTVPSYGDESAELFKTKHYLSSTAFMDNFSVVFADMLAKDLGFLPLWTEEATVCGASISVKTTTAKLEITPTIRCKASNWPEKAVEWIMRSRVEAYDQRTEEMYKWPSGAMIQDVIGKGYYMVPFGFVPRKGNNPAFEREWRIEFPEAERYLETCLSDTQLRCYIFCLLLFQIFFKLEHSVTEDHLRHVLFWQAENLTLAWANYEMSNNIRAVFDSLYEHLSRQELPNYFIRQRNDFLSIPRARLHAVQKRLFSFRENPFGHIVAALRRLHFPGSTLNLDLGRLMELIRTTYDVELINPDLKYMNMENMEQTGRKKNSDESDGFWADIRKHEDPKKNWRRQWHRKQEEQKKQVENKRRESEATRPERPLVEVDLRKTTYFSAIRRRFILEFFIEHFMQLVAGAGRPPPSSEMLNHVNNLLMLLSEHLDADDTRIEDWRDQLQRVRLAPQGPRKAAKRGPLQLPPGEVSANWTLQSVEVEVYRGRRMMRDAPPTMVFHRLDEESENSDESTAL